MDLNDSLFYNILFFWGGGGGGGGRLASLFSPHFSSLRMHARDTGRLKKKKDWKKIINE